MLTFGSIGAVASALDRRALNAAELCEATIGRIVDHDGRIGAFSCLLAEKARQEAAASDRRRAGGQPRGILDGIPVAIKNLIDVQGESSTAGLSASAARKALVDAPVIGLLRGAGAVIVGLTETDAGGFGTSTPQTSNPLDTTLIAGGSSGGSAAAVAAGFAFGALGTDTGGSVRIPAACCSVVGFKPTHGRVCLHGVRPVAPSFDHVGPIARSIDDILAIQLVIDPTMKRERIAAIEKSPKIGVDYSWFEGAGSESHAALDHIERSLARAGFSHGPISLPDRERYLKAHIENALREAFDLHSASGVPASDFPEVALDSLRIGEAVTDLERARNEEQRRLLVQEVDQLLAEVDLIIVPVLPMNIPRVGMKSTFINGDELSVLEASIRFTALFNLTGHPAVSIPALLLPNGRAVNVQLVGRKNCDLALLHHARRLADVFDARAQYAALINQFTLCHGGN